jgi:zinc protease
MRPLPNQSLRERVLTIALASLVVAVIAYLTRRPDSGDCCSATLPALDERLAIDPNVRADTLSNGLRYYVLANGAPSGMAELRLVVNAGSILEDEDQRGLAHAVEHMAFRGTTSFPGSRVTDYLQPLGLRSGYDVNATTSFDETIYRLTIPTDSAPVLDTAIAILADWAQNVTFDSAAARREAGVVFEEWRSSSDASARLTRERDALLLGGSRYVARFPIGDTAVMRRFDVGAMRKFYREWYRPELMAVVAVGDFDADDVEALIRRRFDAIRAIAESRARPSVTVPPMRSARAVVLSDAEATGTRVALWFARAHAPSRTVGNFREALIEELTRGILDARLEDAAEQPNSPLLSASASVSALVKSVEAVVVGGVVVDGEAASAVAALAEEVARLQRFGASSPELERAKAAMMRDRRETDTYGRFSSDIADELVWHELHGDDAVGERRAYELANALLPAVHSSDVARAAGRLSLDSGMVVVVTTSERPGPSSPTTSALLAAARTGAERAVDVEHDSTAMPALVRTAPIPGTIASERVLSEIDAFEWTLGNGMRVILKPTDWSDEVLMRITGPGGASLAERALYPSAFMADRVLEATGVGSVTGSRLARLLGETSVELTPIVTDDWVQLDGSAAPRDVVMLFELAHLYFSAPRSDSVAFRRYQRRARAFARNREGDPEAVFDDSVAGARRAGAPGAISGSRAFADAVELDAAIRFWRERVANASNFTVVLVGDFSLDGARTLVRRYLASLPSGQRELSRDSAVTPPPGAVERSFRRGTEPKARTQILLSGVVELTPVADATLNVLRDLMEMVLETRLRETMGGTYGVSVDLSVQPTPRSLYRFGIEFTGAPERVDSLAAAALGELERLCRHGPSVDEASKVRAAALRDIESGAEANDSWLSELAWHAHLGWPLESVRVHREVTDTLEPLAFQGACRQFLDPTRYVRITRHPVASSSPAQVH